MNLECPPSPSTCPRCGSAATGRFCSDCGAPLGPPACSHCGAALTAGARFCTACGREVGPPARHRWPARGTLLIAAAAVGLLALLALLFTRELRVRSEATPPEIAGPAATARPPDLSRMTPREQFDSLYNRVMRASEAGDAAAVGQFGPMALLAYRGLDSIDADARYHAAMLRLHTGDADGARALTDTLLTASAGHLLGLLLRGAIARLDRDQPARLAVYRDFIAGYDAEIASGRQEYGDHRIALDRFLAEARASLDSAPGR